MRLPAATNNCQWQNSYALIVASQFEQQINRATAILNTGNPDPFGREGIKLNKNE